MVNLFKSFQFIHNQAWKDFIRNFHKRWVIIITIFISTFVLFLISTLNFSINQELQKNTQTILGGDAEIETHIKSLDQEIIEEIKSIGKISLNTSLTSMASNGNDKNSKTAFIRLRAVDDNYPLYGSITTSHPNRLKLFYTEDNQVLINENLSRNLNVKAGDTILLRNHQFIVNSVIQDIPDIGGAGIFGDLALINQEGLNLLDIKSSENFLEYEYRVKFSDDLEVKNARNSLKEILIDIPETRLRFPENTSNFLQRTLDNFSNFLSLISLTAILISGIGIANTIIAFINQNQTSIAVQKSLGLSSRMIQLIYGYQILFLTFILCIIAFFMSGMFPHFINPFLPTSLGLNLQVVFNLGIFVRVSLITILAISIFLIPALNAIHKLSANSLFRNSFEFVNFNLTKKTIIINSILVTFLIFLFTWGSPLWFTNIIFLCGFIASIIIFYFTFKVLTIFMLKFHHSFSLSYILAKRNILSPQSLAPIILTTLGMGITLLLTIIYIGFSFQTFVNKGLNNQVPDYFFININQDIKNDFVKKLTSYDPKSEINIVPLATARVKEINGVDPRSYIDRNNNSSWVIRGERRVSWSKEPAENNPIIEGQWWTNNPTEDLLISFDYDAAIDLGIQLEDIITLSIYGREVQGTVKNFRKVDYADFTINFAMILNTSYAEKIPHEFIATINLPNNITINESELLKNFPNISSIKVASYIEKINNLLNKVSLAVLALSLVIIVIGFLVISSAILVQGKSQLYQHLIFKILGLKKSIIIKTSILEFTIIFLTTIGFTTLLSSLASYLILNNIFNIEWAFNIPVTFLIFLIVGIITLLMILKTTMGNLNPKVYPLIRNN
ncbi:MAG: ABC transporter permease [Alphaproteobacteria bacterium]|jgi:putative ABC transport system permease protein|tara:strand:- start:55 stop:2586 length:2532 start_codon:yes stop_codon:yes gene_type:complete